MALTKIVSKISKNACLDSQLYNFITDFRNIGLMLPPDMQEKVSYTESSISIEAMAGMNVTLIILEQEPHSLVKLGAEGSEELTIWIQLKQVAPYDTRIRVTIHARIPAIAKFIGKKKLQTFADGFADALAQIPTIAFQSYNFN
ncbi:MAG: hypothetical protein ACOCWB_04335 [Bacteroidota bacterium]